MPTACEIDFVDNHERVYYAGQLLKGTVCLSLTSEKTVRGVYVEIYGKAYVHWTETESRRRNGKQEQVTRSYTGEEIYLSERTYFVGGASGSVDLRPGTFNHTFQCMLPAQLPTSVNGQYGYIEYGIHIVLDIQLWPDKKFTEEFTVIKPINLNAVPGMREPVVCERVKTFMPCGFLCCWTSDPLRIVARTPVSGYTPGQTINLTINIYNESDVPIIGVEAYLIKNINFYARLNGHGQEHHRSIDTTLQRKGTEDGCDMKQNKIIRLDMELPSIPPTDFSTSKIIKVNYYIEVFAEVEGCCTSNPKLRFPITIGTHPIQDFIVTQPMVQQPTVPYPTTPQPSAPQPTAPPNSSEFTNFPYPTMPADPSAPPSYDLSNDPPTYEEAISGGGPSEKKFKPKYPMFRRQTSYSIGE